MIGRHHQLMVATTDEEEDRKGEGIQGSGAGRMGPSTLSEGGDVRGWMETPSTNSGMEKEGGWSRLSQGFYPSRAAPFLKVHGHADAGLKCSRRYIPGFLCLKEYS